MPKLDYLYAIILILEAILTFLKNIKGDNKK